MARSRSRPATTTPTTTDRRPTPTHTTPRELTLRRPTVIVGIASEQRNEICAELEGAGFPVAIVTGASDLDAVLRGTPGVGAVILDAYSDLDSALGQADRIALQSDPLPTLMIVGD